MRAGVGLLAAVCVVTVSCGEGEVASDSPDSDQTAQSAADEPDDSAPAESDAEAPEEVSEHASGCPYAGDDAVKVSPECIDPWPLTEDSAEVFCEPHDQALVRVDGRGVYPLNGMAMSQQPDLPELEAVWLENPELEGTRINIGELTSIALDLC